jgi:probable F420-dependent oxidoreductase
MSSPIAIGCTLPASGPNADPGGLRMLAQTAEDLGFDSVWVSDHLVIPVHVASAYPYSPDSRFRLGPAAPYFEPLTVLTFLAGCTRRVRLGTHVLILPYRHPIITAKVVATLDVISGGRVDLGVGVGWMEEEFVALGHDYFARRGAVTDEQIQILKVLWTEETPDHAGEFYRFPALGAHPHPVQQPHPPIWVGGHSRAAIRRAARLGDGWLPIGARPPASLPPAEVATSLRLLREEATRAGRVPDSLQVCFSTNVALRDTATSATGDRSPFQGNPEQVAADLDAYRAVGIDRFVLGFGPGGPDEIAARLRRFREQVWPAVREA